MAGKERVGGPSNAQRAFNVCPARNDQGCAGPQPTITRRFRGNAKMAQVTALTTLKGIVAQDHIDGDRARRGAGSHSTPALTAYDNEEGLIRCPAQRAVCDWQDRLQPDGG